jgi:hypothetical protein
MKTKRLPRSLWSLAMTKRDSNTTSKGGGNVFLLTEMAWIEKGTRRPANNMQAIGKRVEN